MWKHLNVTILGIYLTVMMMFVIFFPTKDGELVIMDFVLIPQTNLEVASSGSGNNRIIFFRVAGYCEPINTMNVSRIVLIGKPEKLLKEALAQKYISRFRLGELIPKVSGNTYLQLKRYLDNYEV